MKGIKTTSRTAMMLVGLLTLAAPLATLHAQKKGPNKGQGGNKEQAVRKLHFKHVTSDYSSKAGRKITNLQLRYALPEAEADGGMAWSDPIEIRLENQAFSMPVKYEGPNQVGVFVEGEKKPFTNIKFPQGKQSLLLFIATANAKRPYDVVAVSDKDFAYGKYKLMNLTSTKIGVKLGKMKLSLNGRETKDILPSVAQMGGPRFPVQFFSNEKGESRRFSATQWSVLKDLRTLVFFFKDPKSGRYTYRGVDDYFISEEAIAGFVATAEKNPEKNYGDPQVDENGFPRSPVTLLSPEEKSKIGKEMLARMESDHRKHIARLKAMTGRKPPKIRKPVVVKPTEEPDIDLEPVFKGDGQGGS